MATARPSTIGTTRPPRRRFVFASVAALATAEGGGIDATAGGTVTEMLEGVGGRWRFGRGGLAATGSGAGVGLSLGIVAASLARSCSSRRVVSRVLIVFPSRVAMLINADCFDSPLHVSGAISVGLHPTMWGLMVLYFSRADG
jgi:hypothetical protein